MIYNSYSPEIYKLILSENRKNWKFNLKSPICSGFYEVVKIIKGGQKTENFSNISIFWEI